MDSHETSAAPVPQVEPAVAMVVFTTMGQDQIMGTVYVSTVTASIEVMKLGGPLIGSWPLRGYHTGVESRLGGGPPLTDVIRHFSPQWNYVYSQH